MPVVIDAHTVNSAANVSTLGLGLTIAAGSDRLLVGMSGWVNTVLGTLTSSDWGGTALTEVTDNGANYVALAVSRLIAPTAGADTLTFNYSAAQSAVVIFGLSVTGADQTTPLGTVAVTAGSSTTPWVACQGTANGLAVGLLSSDSETAISPVNSIPEYIAVGTAAQHAGTTNSITATGAPAGLMLGDYEFLSVANENNEALTITGTGWATVGARITQGASWQESLFYRKYDGSNVDPVISWTTATAASARRWSIRDAHWSSPIGTAASNTGSAASHTIGAGINSSTSNSLVMYVDHAEANTALGADADYTEAFDAGSATGPYRLVVGRRDQAVAGAGAAAFTATGALASWVLRLQEILAAGTQTQRREAQNVNLTSGGSFDTEDGQATNQFGWTVAASAGWRAAAFCILPAAAGGGATIVGRNPFWSPIFESKVLSG